MSKRLLLVGSLWLQPVAEDRMTKCLLSGMTKAKPPDICLINLDLLNRRQWEVVKQVNAFNKWLLVAASFP